uniref:Uncharacterized protein n=2 Tax=viral metagenome TaxID=1070528 RepID=A0A6M3K562_9ZZZZ
MDATKCDLSFDEVTLDYDALKRVAAIAVGKCVTEIERHKNELHDACFKLDTTMVHLSGHRLCEEAMQLELATEVYACLCGGKTRHKVTIVNHMEELDDRK